MAHTVHPAPVSFSEVPAHTAIASTEPALRVLLDAPSDLPLVQWQISPLVQVSRHLIGCTWQLVGCVVPTLVRYPGYPFMQSPDDPATHLQVWLWRIFKPPPHHQHPRPMPLGWNRPWGDIHWHPDRGTWVTLDLRPHDTRDTACQVWGWVHWSQRYAGGRPEGTSDKPAKEVLVSQIREAKSRVREAEGYPSYRRVWNEMGNHGTGSTLKKWVRSYQLLWRDL